ncbi:MAG: hypothetical protein H6Q19_735 [Bacteroidetes bacterium]|nr:hypothetical protein [Bacteroidota bacterium]
MISVIICSKHGKLSESLARNIDDTIGVPYEIVCINNSRNEYSIFSAYNKGIAQSKYPFLCFVHEDVNFQTKNWGNIIKSHLNNSTTGLIGVAGSNTVLSVPSSWSSSQEKYINIIQSGKHSEHIRLPIEHNDDKQEVILLDGVFLGANRDIFSKIAFDEKLKGFHGYDLDICLQSAFAGFQNYVVFDVLIEHYSKGFRNKRYFENLIQVFGKWDKYLPIYDKNKYTAEEILKSEEKMINYLFIKMIKRGFSAKEIKSTITFYIDKIKSENLKIKYIHINQKIFFLQLVYKPFTRLYL